MAGEASVEPRGRLYLGHYLRLYNSHSLTRSTPGPGFGGLKKFSVRFCFGGAKFNGKKLEETFLFFRQAVEELCAVFRN